MKLGGQVTAPQQNTCVSLRRRSSPVASQRWSFVHPVSRGHPNGSYGCGSAVPHSRCGRSKPSCIFDQRVLPAQRSLTRTEDFRTSEIPSKNLIFSVRENALRIDGSEQNGYVSVLFQDAADITQTC